LPPPEDVRRSLPSPMPNIAAQPGLQSGTPFPRRPAELPDDLR